MKANKAFALCLLLLAGGGLPAQEDRALPELPYEGKQTLTGTLARIDVTCILRSWRIKGAMVCLTPSGGIRACLWVENAWPSGLVEVVRQPWKTHFAEMKGALQSLKGAPTYGVSSTHGPMAGDGTANQFAEARVYTYVPDYGLSQSEIPLAVPSSSPFTPNYVSELDGFGWRNPLVDSFTSPEAMLARLKSCSIPDPRLCAGTWGGYYPRIGFINHESEVVAAYVQALRAGRAAAMPLGRIVLQPYAFEPRTGHYIQMLEPSYRSCVAIGFPFTKAIEVGAGSKFGSYLFIHFGVFEVCKGCLPTRLTQERAPL